MNSKEEYMASTCTNCAAPLEAGTKFCGACGSAVEARTSLPQSAPPPPSPGPTASHSRRYPALRIIALLLKILAAMTGIGGVITGFSAATITSALPSYPGIARQGNGGGGKALGWIIFPLRFCFV